MEGLSFLSYAVNMKPDLSYTPGSGWALPNSEQHTISAQYMGKRESLCDRHEVTVL